MPLWSLEVKMYKILVLATTFFILLTPIQNLNAQAVAGLAAFTTLAGKDGLGLLGKASGTGGELMRLMQLVGVNKEIRDNIGVYKDSLDNAYTLSRLAMLNYERIQALGDLDARSLTELNNSISELKDTIESSENYAKRLGIELNLVKLQNEENVNKAFRESILQELALKRVEQSASGSSLQAHALNTAKNTSVTNLTLVDINQKLQDLLKLQTRDIERNLVKEEQDRRKEAKIKEILGITTALDIQENMGENKGKKSSAKLPLKDLILFDVPFIKELSEYIGSNTLALILICGAIGLVLSLFNGIKGAMFTVRDMVQTTILFTFIGSTIFWAKDIGLLGANKLYYEFVKYDFFTNGLGAAIGEIHSASNAGFKKDPWYYFFLSHVFPLSTLKEVGGYIMVILVRLPLLVLKVHYTYTFIIVAAGYGFPLAIYNLPYFKDNLKGIVSDILYLLLFPTALVILLLFFSAFLSSSYTGGIIGNTGTGFWFTLVLLIMMPSVGFYVKGWLRGGGASEGGVKAGAVTQSIVMNTASIGMGSLFKGGMAGKGAMKLFEKLGNLGKNSNNAVDPLTGGAEVTRFNKAKNKMSEGLRNIGNKYKSNPQASKINEGLKEVKGKYDNFRDSNKLKHHTPSFKSVDPKSEVKNPTSSNIYGTEPKKSYGSADNYLNSSNSESVQSQNKPFQKQEDRKPIQNGNYADERQYSNSRHNLNSNGHKEGTNSSAKDESLKSVNPNGSKPQSEDKIKQYEPQSSSKHKSDTGTSIESGSSPKIQSQKSPSTSSVKPSIDPNVKAEAPTRKPSLIEQDLKKSREEIKIKSKPTTKPRKK